MTLLLILLMIFFGVVLLWAGVRLHRMLRAVARPRVSVPTLRAAGCYHFPRHATNHNAAGD